MLLLQPHLPVVDHRGDATRFVALGGPLDTLHALQVHAALRRAGRPLVGFTNHKRFPLDGAETAAAYLDECLGWCHCFRDTTGFGARPQLDLSHSDLVDVDYVSPRTFGAHAPRWDYAYVCLPGPEVEKAKGWPLARACVGALSRAGFAGLLVGRSPVRDLAATPRVTVRPRLRWAELLQALASSRCLLVTSVTDASPRVLAEALALDRPVVVHRDILGGWKYVDDATGAFFEGGHDVVDTVSRVLAADTSPREWYAARFGLTRSGARLRDFLNDLGGDLRGPYVTLGSVPSADPWLAAASEPAQPAPA